LTYGHPTRNVSTIAPAVLALLVCAARLESQSLSHQKVLPSPPPSSPSHPNLAIKMQGSTAAARSALDGAAELAAFFERLHHAPDEPVHVLHFGDSHTAGDEWTAALRNLFQRRFGIGGPGFALAGQPFAGYRRMDAAGSGSSGWTKAGFAAAAGDGYFGLGGISLAAERAGQTLSLAAHCDTVEVQYLQQRHGGKIALYDSSQLLDEFSTDGELQPEFRTFNVAPGAHQFRLATTGNGPVRIFGWTADMRQGISYESLGLNGARASVILRWNEEMLETYLRRRDPGLIVLAYGTNDAGDGQSADHYEETFAKVLSRLRRMAPEAAILVIGPPDATLRSFGQARSSTEIGKVVTAQKNAARRNGCAFWDMREHMGGVGSMPRWASSGLVQSDHLHFTPAGYRALAEGMFTDLMRHYATYERVRSQVIVEPTRD
jgi:lysophospholipase L1-like esterase